MNQKTLNIIYGIMIVFLFLVVSYFAVVKKPEPIASPKLRTNTDKLNLETPPTTTNPISNLKLYSNTQYAYTIKYPSDWFVDTNYSENDFTQRGPVEDNEFIGGDTTWSNYNNPGQYTPGTIPSDFIAVYLLVYKTDAQTTLDNFIESKHFSYSKKEKININGISGIQMTTEEPKNSNSTSKMVLLKVGNKVFKFSHARNSIKSSNIMKQMLQNFKLN